MITFELNTSENRIPVIWNLTSNKDNKILHRYILKFTLNVVRVIQR